MPKKRSALLIIVLCACCAGLLALSVNKMPAAEKQEQPDCKTLSCCCNNEQKSFSPLEMISEIFLRQAA